MPDDKSKMSDASKIIILTGPGGGLNSGLIKRAVTELVADGFGSVMHIEELSECTVTGPLLVIDGDSRRSLFKKVQALSVAPEFHLVVTDLGIETDDDTGFDAEDLQLLKDGIQAECTLVESAAPRISCPCCGWKTL